MEPEGSLPCLQGPATGRYCKIIIIIIIIITIIIIIIIDES
jgi:hypothetical protein